MPDKDIINNIVVCSTFKYYKDLRKLIRFFINGLHSYNVWLGEDKTYGGITLSNELEKMVLDSDLAVIIIGPIYGSKPYRENISYTNIELNAAIKKIKEDKRFYLIYVDQKISEIYNALSESDKDKLNNDDAFNDSVLLELLKKNKSNVLSDCSTNDLVKLLQMFHLIISHDYIWKYYDAETVLNELYEFLDNNIQNVIEKHTLISKEKVKEYTFLNNHLEKYPYLPRNGDIEYELNEKIKDINSALRMSIRDLFLIGRGKNPIALKKFIIASNEAFEVFVTELINSIDEACINGSNTIYFTDPAINLGGDVWVKNRYFKRIMTKTIEKYDVLVPKSFDTRSVKFVRIFILDSPFAFETGQTDKALIILIQLSLGINIGLFTKSFLSKKYSNIFKPSNQNFFLLKEKILGFLDIEFPYIRMHSINPDHIYGANDSEKQIKKIFNQEMVSQYSIALAKLCDEESSSFFWLDNPNKGLCDGSPDIEKAIALLRESDLASNLKNLLKKGNLNNFLNELQNKEIIKLAIKEIDTILKNLPN